MKMLMSVEPNSQFVLSMARVKGPFMGEQTEDDAGDEIRVQVVFGKNVGFSANTNRI